MAIALENGFLIRNDCEVQISEQEANYRRDEYKSLEMYCNKRFFAMDDGVGKIIQQVLL